MLDSNAVCCGDSVERVIGGRLECSIEVYEVCRKAIVLIQYDGASLLVDEISSLVGTRTS